MSRGRRTADRTILVTMPFVALDHPPLGVSLLKARLEQEGMGCDVAYLHLAFAAAIGVDLYERILGLPFTSLAGEWVFAPALFGSKDRLPAGYEDDVLRGFWQRGGEDVDTLHFAQARVEEFLRDMETSVPWGDYLVVGFSSFFAQNLAALALARRIKELHPGVVLVFGGNNWHGEMGRQLLRSFPFVDAACTGEGDEALPRFVRRLIAGTTPRIATGDMAAGLGVDPITSGLDDLPYPAHEGYLTAARDHGLPSRSLVLDVETSRGCWWADRHPCRFCGLNGETSAYRTKSPERILRELRHLAALPGCRLLEVVDNVVSPEFLTTVLPRLVEDPLPVPLFFELRPDATRQDVRNIAAAGAHVQFGIESLSDEVLRLMRKGSDGLKNIRLLRWCAEEDVPAAWNYLYDVPGESAEGYEEVLRVLPALTHLKPPGACSHMSLDRFSPFFEDAERSGITSIRPLAPYRYLYPLDQESLMGIANAFDYELGSGVRPVEARTRLRREVAAWRRDERPAGLAVKRTSSGGLCLLDGRRDPERLIELDPVDGLLYGACEDIATFDELERLVEGAGLDGDGELGARLSRLVEERLMARSGDRYLSLALFKETAADQA